MLPLVQFLVGQFELQESALTNLVSYVAGKGDLETLQYLIAHFHFSDQCLRSFAQLNCKDQVAQWLSEALTVLPSLDMQYKTAPNFV